MESVIDFKFNASKLYHAEDLDRISEESGIEIGYNADSFLTRLMHDHEEVLQFNGTEVDEMDEF